MRDYPQLRYNPASQAKANQIKRESEMEVEERNKNIPVFMFQGFGFRPYYRAMNGSLNIRGPLCPRPNIKGEICFSDLVGNTEETNVLCDVCGFTGVLPQSFEKFRQIAHKKYEGHLRYIESGGNIITLDVPYDAIKASDKDDMREIKIKWSQKDGRNMAVIYFIEKNDKGEKTQIMVDMDREELRYDPSDINPGKIIAKVKAEFPNANVSIDYKNNEASEK